MLEKSEFQTKVNDVAIILGFTVDVESYKKYDSNVRLKKNNMELGIRQNEYRDAERISIDGYFPRAKNGQAVMSYSSAISKEITVSEKKTAKQIANDIQKRFMPNYILTVAKAQEWIDVIDEREAIAKAKVDKLIANIPGAVNKQSYNDGVHSYYRSLVYNYGSNNRSFADMEITIGEGESHKLELDNVTTDQIIAIMKLINRA